MCCRIASPAAALLPKKYGACVRLKEDWVLIGGLAFSLQIARRPSRFAAVSDVIDDGGRRRIRHAEIAPAIGIHIALFEVISQGPTRADPCGARITNGAAVRRGRARASCCCAAEITGQIFPAAHEIAMFTRCVAAALRIIACWTAYAPCE